MAHILARTQSSAEPNTDSPSFRRGLSELVTGKDKSREAVNEPSHVVEADPRDRRKRVSFFAKLRGKDTNADEDLQTTDELARAEGAHAATFCTKLQSERPTYIRVRSSNKPVRDFNNLFLAQELVGTMAATDANPIEDDAKAGAIWSMKFSNDGKYLATGGQDMVVRVWRVLSSPNDRRRRGEAEAAVDSALNAPVFCAKPYREYQGHTADVLDLSWSRNNFLLSSSMDKTVRLWHVSRSECLCCFQHSDFVTSIAFHPRDDRFFISGSLDCKLRLWNISEKKVENWNESPELITAVAFDPMGRMAIAGSFTGLCLFYETEKLRYHTQIQVKSSRGRNSQGSKITGIQAVSLNPDNPHSDVKLLITSNDSRVRIYNMRDKSLETKLKGNDNKCSQIRATFNDDLSYVICGSEDRQVYIWDARAVTGSKDKRPFEHFEAHTNIVTATCFAPNNAREHLAASGDPIYEIVSNHPRRSMLSSNQSTSSHDTNDSATHNPTDGNIIICADYSGRIKVFRQDSAATLRNRGDSCSETASISSRRPPAAKSSFRPPSNAVAPQPLAPAPNHQEPSQIVRKPHELIVPSSPARLRTGTALSSTCEEPEGIETTPSIQLNGTPVKNSTESHSALHKSMPDHRNGNLAPEESSNGHSGRNPVTDARRDDSRTRSRSRPRRHVPATTTTTTTNHTESRHRDDPPQHEHQDDDHHDHHNHHPHHDEYSQDHHNKSSSLRSSSKRTSGGAQKGQVIEANPFMSHDGTSLGFYDTAVDEGRDVSSEHTRPSTSRMESTTSTQSSSLGGQMHSPVHCPRCKSQSFAATKVRGQVRLTCQKCHSLVD